MAPPCSLTRAPRGSASAFLALPLAMLPLLSLASAARANGELALAHPKDSTAAQGMLSSWMPRGLFGMGRRRTLQLAQQGNLTRTTTNGAMRLGSAQQGATVVDTPATGYCEAASVVQGGCYLSLSKTKYMSKTAQTLYTGFLKNPALPGGWQKCGSFYNPQAPASSSQLGKIYFSIICPGTQTVLSVQTQDLSVGKFIQTAVVYSGDTVTPWSTPSSALYVVMNPLIKTSTKCLSIYVSVICAA